MSLFTKVRDEAEDVWNALLSYLTPVEQKVVAFAEPALHDIATEIGDDGVAAVEAAVAAAESAGGTGPDKLTFAKKALENTLKAAKPGLKDSLVNAAIEIAVVGLKALVPAL